MAVNDDNYKKEFSLPAILNLSFDPVLQTLVFQQMGFDGSNNPQRPIAQSMALKMTESGGYTYIAIAPPGTPQGDAKWQVKRIDETTSGTTVVTWADGDYNFDNIATNLTSLTYS